MSKYGDEARAILARHSEAIALADSLAGQLKKEGKLKKVDDDKLTELKAIKSK